MAGLGAAWRLKSSKLKFQILEAQRQAGGRISGENLRDCSGRPYDVINAGAQWLHGKKNLLYKIAAEHDLLHTELSEETLGVYYRPDGSKVSEFFVKKVDFKIGQILEECEKFAESGFDYPESVEKFLLKKFGDFLLTLNEKDQKVAQELLDFHIRFQIIDNSCLSLADVSAKDWGTYSFNGESCQAHINFKNSFSDLIHVLAEKIKHNLAYNKVVDQICWGTNSDPPNAHVLVRCKDGSVYEANQVVVTFSLGVLKERQSKLFNPELPQLHQQVIESFGFGTINKIYLHFEESWWGKVDGIQIVFDDVLSDDAHWSRFLSGFDVLQPGLEHTLLGWVGGQGALEMEKLDDRQVIQDCVDLMRKCTRMKVPQPKAYHV